LKVTVLVPWLEPKFAPAIVTGVPTGPASGDRLEINGLTTTQNCTGLLATPPTVTTTFTHSPATPVGTGTTMLVALQLVGVASTPLNVTVLAPFVDPKFTPDIVTDVPAGPAVGERLAMHGPDPTVNVTPLLAMPLTVTTTLPLVAPDGT
jgi:hypothetical protein